MGIKSHKSWSQLAGRQTGQAGGQEGSRTGGLVPGTDWEAGPLPGGTLRTALPCPILHHAGDRNVSRRRAGHGVRQQARHRTGRRDAKGTSDTLTSDMIVFKRLSL
jgi:hypothetical protein